MIEPNPNVTAFQIRTFGLLLLVFAGLLGGLVIWRGEALIGAAIFLGSAWLFSLTFNPAKRLQQLLGAVLPGLCAAIGLSVKTGSESAVVANIVWIVGGVIGLATIAIVPFGRVVYTGWMLAAVPIGWTVSHVILAIVYYLVLVPIGLIMRCCGRDPMCRRFEPNADSYWVKHQAVTESKRYFQQF